MTEAAMRILEKHEQPTIKRDYKRDLPKGVYLDKGTGRFEAQVWKRNNGKVMSVGVYDTPAEAKYMRKLALDGHHWDLMPEDRQENFGFIYQMTHRATGKLYIGSKQFHFWDGPVGGWKCTDPNVDEWDASLWKDSDWHSYKSSATDVAKDASETPWAWEYKVLSLHKNKLSLNLAEVHMQIERGVLTTTDANGDYLYLNGNIMGKAYRPPVPIEKLRAMREDSKAALRDYYLKPTLCTKCGTMLPFGETRCPQAPLFGDGDCNGSHKTND